MSTDNDSHDDAVTKARTVLHDTIKVAGLSEFTATAVLAAAESYAKAMRSQCEPHADRSAVSR